jgi:radical SAM protein with 4Fe4S-binding SPASM domain
VAWNLTRRCNLACAHCYISAGPTETADRDLTTEEFCRITDEILALNPAPMFILSGGEPLLRDDLDILAEYASRRGATVVVGTNGTQQTTDRIRRLKDHGVQGVAVSVDSLDASYHDRFRRGHGALAETLAAVDRLAASELDFLVQTTITRGNRSELRDLVTWSAERGAVAFNTYFLVATGRAAKMSNLSAAEYEDALTELVGLHREYVGRMMVRAKCAPQFMRLVREHAPESPMLNYPTRCPCGVQYCRITPDGHVTACPYLPLPAGDLRQDPFAVVWRSAPLFTTLREMAPEGKCGRCEYRVVCGGCRARAFAETGDYLAADESCAYEPDGMRPLVTSSASTSYGDAAAPEMEWAPDALERIERIPSFVRGVVVTRVEQYARERGHARVTGELLRDVRRHMPVDFSKRLPFFTRND